MTRTIKTVWVFASSSRPDKLYQTLEYDDGSTSCECPGWTRRVAVDGSRTCRHTRSVECGTADRECVRLLPHKAARVAPQMRAVVPEAVPTRQGRKFCFEMEEV